MSIKFLCGFEFRNRTDDGFTFVGGFDNWTNVAFAPPSSNGVYSLKHGFSVAGNYVSPCTSAFSECWLGSIVYSPGSASTVMAGVCTGATTRYIEAGIVNGAWEIYVNGTSKATSPGAPLAQWNRLHMHIEGLADGDTIRLYKEGDLATPVVQYSLTSSDVSGWPATLSHVRLHTSNQVHVDDLWLMDPTDATGVTDPQETLSFSVELLTADANGADFTFATGSFSDIDEVPFSLADKITADAVGQIADLSFTNASTAQVVGAVKVTQRTQRSGTTAGSQAEVSIDDGANNNAIETVSVPGDGYIRTYISEAADGTSLEVDKLNASTIQIKTVT